MRATLLRVVALAALFTAVIPPADSRADWPHDYRMVPALLGGAGASNQVVDATVSDGAGGAFVFMEDDRAGNMDIYGIHVLGNGTLDPTWPLNGLAVCTANGSQTVIRAIDDGNGALWVCWTDSRSGIPAIFATRVLKNGTVDPVFPPNGLALDPAHANAQHDQSICLSPTNGLVTVWEYDFSNTDHDIYGASLNPVGFQWAATALHESGLNDTKPAVSAEGTAFAVVWDQVTTARYARHLFSTGAPTGSEQVVTSSVDANVGPKICPDGWGGSYVGYCISASNYSVAATRFFGGNAVLTYNAVGGGAVTPYQLGGMVYAGDFQAWLSFSNIFGGTTSMVALYRDGNSAPAQIGSVGSTPKALIVDDGSGGAILTAQTGPDTYIQGTRRNGGFATPGLWSSVPRLTELPIQVIPSAICSDGNAGALVFSYDHGSSPSLAHMIRVDRWGALDGAPVIQSVKDVANDQGGHVRVSWKASYLDNEIDQTVDGYRLWRQVPTAALQSMRAASAASVKPFREDSDEAIELGGVRIQQTATGTIAWELAATQVANAFPSYSLTVESLADSTGGGPANALYMVEARNTPGALGWASPPDSGHSVDNLPPAMPAPFNGAIVGGVQTRLHWGPNAESDLAGYQLYRGGSAGFAPGPGNLVATTSDTTYLDASTNQYYKLDAIDVHGNHSSYALLTPSGTLDAPGAGAPREVSLALASANPSVGGATLRYTLAQPGRVRLALFAVDGRCARELVSTELPAGEYTVRWDGRDTGGHVAASGIYFARLTAGGVERVRRFALAH